MYCFSLSSIQKEKKLMDQFNLQDVSVCIARVIRSRFQIRSSILRNNILLLIILLSEPLLGTFMLSWVYQVLGAENLANYR